MEDQTFVSAFRASSSHPSRPLRYATKSELVYQSLREQIVSGGLLAGERLYLEEISEQFGVSTNPVRDAFRRLEAEGLITNRPHVGATVAAIDEEQIEIHFAIRGALEGLAVRLAIHHLTSADFDRLTSLSHELDQLAESQDFQAWDSCNLDFYRLLFSFARSSELAALINLQRDRSPRYRHFPSVLKQRAQETAESRRTLLDALRAGDADAAERLQRANVSRVGQLLSDAMRQAAQSNATPDVEPMSDGQRG